MDYQERFGVTLNVVTKEVDYANIMYSLDPVDGRVVFADQEILPPKSKIMDEVGGMGTGQAGTHRATKVHRDKVLARGVPLLTWTEVTKIFDISEKEKTTLMQAAFKVVGKDKFRGDIAARFDKVLPTHYSAYRELAASPVEIVTAPNTPRKKLVEKDGAFQTVPG